MVYKSPINDGFATVCQLAFIYFYVIGALWLHKPYLQMMLVLLFLHKRFSPALFTCSCSPVLKHNPSFKFMKQML